MKFLFNKKLEKKIQGLKEYKSDAFKDLRGEVRTNYDKKKLKDW